MSYDLNTLVLSADVLVNQASINLEKQNSYIYTYYKQAISPHVNKLVNAYLRPKLPQIFLSQNMTSPIFMQIRVRSDGAVFLRHRRTDKWEPMMESQENLGSQHPVSEIIIKTNEAYSRLINTGTSPTTKLAKQNLANIESEIARNIKKSKQLQQEIDQKQNEVAVLEHTCSNLQYVVQSMATLEQKIIQSANKQKSAEISQLQQQITSKEQKITDTKKILQSTLDEVAILKQTNSSLQSTLEREITNKKSKEQELQQQITDKEGELTNLKQTLQLANKKKSAEISQLQQQITSKEQKITHTKKILQSTLDEVAILKQTNRSSQSTKLTKQNLANIEFEIARNIKKSKQLQQEIDQKQNEVAVLEHTCSDLQYAVQSMATLEQKILQSANKQKSAEISQLQQQITSKEQKITHTKKILQSTLDEVAILKQTNSSLQSTLEREITNKKSKEQELQQQITDKEGELTNLKQTLQLANKQKSAEISQLQQQITSKEQKITDTKKILQSTLDKVTILKQTNSSLQSTLEREITNKKGKEQELQQQITDKKGELTNLKQTLQLANKQKSAEISQLQQQITSKEQKITDTKKILQSTLDEVAILKQTNSSLQSTLEREITNKKSKEQELQQQITDKEGELTNLKQTLQLANKQKSAEISQLQQQITSKEQKITDTKKILQSTLDEVAILKQDAEQRSNLGKVITFEQTVGHFQSALQFYTAEQSFQERMDMLKKELTLYKDKVIHLQADLVRSQETSTCLGKQLTLSKEALTLSKQYNRDITEKYKNFITASIIARDNNARSFQQE